MTRRRMLKGSIMLFFEDMKVGARFTGGPVSVTEEDIIAFARSFDPQPFHMDPEAARDSLFRGLAASGWHTTALTMRMIVGSDGQIAGGFIGMGVDTIAWPKPTRPGDVLRLEGEVAELRSSAKRPDSGIGRMQLTTYNQKDEVVLSMVANLLIPRRTIG